MKGSKKCTMGMVGHWLVLVGALNWGLVGLGGFFGSDWNLVHLILGSVMWFENLVYLLVGLSAVGALVGCKCKTCKSDGEGGGSCCKSDKPMDEKMEM